MEIVSKMLDAHTLRRCVDEALSRISSQISVNDVEFARRVYTDGVDKYAARLRQYGFGGLARVLDAGCGFGQWALALSDGNREVTAVDVSETRVTVVNSLVRNLGIRNLSARTASLEKLPFADGTFDGVFCYGALFLSRWKEALGEMVRVLRPMGHVYVNANGIGWYKHLWYTHHNRTVDYDPCEIVANAFRNTVDYRRGRATSPGKDIIIEPDELRAELIRLGLEAIETAPEGRIGLGAGVVPETPPFFQAEYMGDLGVYEVRARKGRG